MSWIRQHLRSPDAQPIAEAGGPDHSLSDAPPSRWSGALEIALFLGLALAVDAVWGQGDRFWTVEPHPFWVIVLLMATQYGTRDALMAAAASSAALLVFNVPAHQIDQDVHAYTVTVLLRPLLWTLAALVLGELRMSHRRTFAALVERVTSSERQVDVLSRTHQELTSIKERLETRLAGQMRTAVSVYQAAKTLESLDPRKVLEGAAELVRIGLNARAYSVFLLEGSELRLASAAGWREGARFPDRYAESSALFQAVVGRQRFVSVAQVDGEQTLAGEGLVAGPLVHPRTGALIGMLKVEELAFLDLNLSSLHTFQALCEWVSLAYANAREHEATRVLDDETSLYASGFLDRQAAYLAHIARRFGFDLSMLLLRVEVDGLTDDLRAKVPSALADVAREVLRKTDLAFDYRQSDHQFAVLLPGAPAENVLVVADKLAAGLSARLGRDVHCQSEVRTLARAIEHTSPSARRGAANEEAA
ncbi:MAG: GAF domain-containing protein [Vicinamibacterales bacterium]